LAIDSGDEESSLELVEDVLDSLSPATSEEVYLATLGVNARAVAAVAAARADAGGGGGSDDQTAAEVPIADAGGYYTSTDVEGALQELADAALQGVIDGGGATITTGVKGDIEVPFDCTIVSARLFADQSGSVVVDVWKDSYANFPPTNGDSITAAAKPTLSSAAKSQDSTLTGWTKTLSKGDVLRFNVDSATTVQRVTLSLAVTRR
jgi:hypothetical protein